MTRNPVVGRDEADDHGINRSRGGLTTKAHALVDGHGRLLCLIVGPGHAGDSPVLPMLLGETQGRPPGPGTTSHDAGGLARGQGVLLARSPGAAAQARD